MKLKNKIAIITGSAGKMGKAIALEFAKQGAKIVICDINSKECREIAKQINHLGSEAISMKCDVTKKSDVKKVVSKTIKKFKAIDILVNNAGKTLTSPITKIREKEWNDIIDTNLKGVFLFSREVSNHMVKKKKGKIININSVAGEVGFLNSSAYCASKGGVVNLTKELAIELSPNNINVNGIAPGIIPTNRTEKMLKNEKKKKELLSNIPLNKFGTPENIADAAVFLASNDSNFITGHNLAVDGGWLTY